MNRVILKINTSGKVEVFSSLKGFEEKYPAYWEKFHHSIKHYISRKKTFYKSKIGGFILQRLFVE